MALNAAAPRGWGGILSHANLPVLAARSACGVALWQVDPPGGAAGAAGGPQAWRLRRVGGAASGGVTVGEAHASGATCNCIRQGSTARGPPRPPPAGDSDHAAPPGDGARQTEGYTHRGTGKSRLHAFFASFSPRVLSPRVTM